MTVKRSEPDDPMMLVGVTLPGDLETMREMAATFADEFAAMGYTEDCLLNLFREPFYKGANQAFQALGEVETRRIVGEAIGFWGRCRVVVHDARTVARGEETLVQIGNPGEAPTGSVEDEETLR